MKAPQIDKFIETARLNPIVQDRECVEKLNALFSLLSLLEKQGDDELRSIWLEAERGSLIDFGSCDDFLEEGVVETEEEFNELWHDYYPDDSKWYKFTTSKYKDESFFFLDSKLIFQLTDHGGTYRDNDSDLEFINWLHAEVSNTIDRTSQDMDSYHAWIMKNLPYQKRFGRILRKNFWSIFPEEEAKVTKELPADIIRLLEKIVSSSEKQPFITLDSLTAGDFFRYCEIGYEANGYFENTETHLSPKEKYLDMADGRDCGMRKIDEQSHIAFKNWYNADRKCGGHPWEICRGGNSTHISLYVEQAGNGWLLRLAGSSQARVIETVKMAVALYQANVPFYLEQANEILNIVTGRDFIGIVPETMIPRYCNQYFKPEDKIIDFMNLGTENTRDIIKKTDWFPEVKLRLCNTNSYAENKGSTSIKT